ncbi:MFS transporter [Musicola paradisiaca]|uniref:Major facilitator superfamily MFS_1 n=1 Tax=Musicola paradisiaca (strain Ech703) TaxID=579405 RepID=C6CCQ9_MUSP7|nr:MFS transporter [Musicola paradisiaca]ACS86902.1 major facilitator superfamily MFS_1 [Musicola paradisiaca Ech703]
MRRVLAVVLACHFLAAFTILGVPLFLPRLLGDLGVDAASPWVGALYSLPTLMTALCAGAWGRFADRFGRRLSLLRALAGLTVAFVMAGLAPSLPWLIAALLLQGVAGGTLAAANGYLAVSLHGDDLGRALNWTQFSARLALLTAPVGLGYVFSQFPALTLSLYLWLALLPLGGLLLAFTLPADTVAGIQPATRDGTPPSPPLLALLSLQFLFNFAMVATFPYFLPYAQRWLTQPWVIGLFYSWPHLLYLLLLPLTARRSPSPRYLVVGLSLMAIAALWHSLLDSAAALLSARSLFGIGMFLGYIGLNQHISRATRQHNAGHWFGRLDAVGKSAGVVAGLAAGWLIPQAGVQAPFVASAIAAVLGLFILLSRHVKEPTYVHIVRRP